MHDQKIELVYTRTELEEHFPDLTDVEWDAFVARMQRMFIMTLTGVVHEDLIRNRLGDRHDVKN